MFLNRSYKLVSDWHWCSIMYIMIYSVSSDTVPLQECDAFTSISWCLSWRKDPIGHWMRRMLCAVVSMWTVMVGGATWQHAAVTVRIWMMLVTGEGGAVESTFHSCSYEFNGYYHYRFIVTCLLLIVWQFESFVKEFPFFCISCFN